MVKKSKEKQDNQVVINKDIKKVSNFVKYNYKKNKEMIWIIGFMIVLLIALLATSSFIKGLNHFNYKSLSFTKERFGEIPVYHYYYYFEKGGQQYQYNLFLRIDPRKNNVSMEGVTEFPAGKTVFIGVNGTGITECPTASRDLGTLGAFFANNLIPIKPGTLDKNEANETNMTYIHCNPFIDNAVIQIFSGNETRIYKEFGNCYNIEISNCRILDAIEKFEVQAILDAKARDSK